MTNKWNDRIAWLAIVLSVAVLALNIWMAGTQR